ncbi:unnamed protein product [Lactuca virosa]|uniref:RRM domain-containing protein n=1 Tax=Lactuca virosa TaxID=75947 RepID=A0AAU9PS49_9ASTR|nr:unnamed protein product [Lactuca virosa]
MGTKKRWNGQKFAFVRFRGVNDISGLEKKLNGISYNGKRLMVNVSRQLRKLTPQKTNVQRHKQPTWVEPRLGVRDHCSYAEVIRPKPPSPKYAPEPPILLKQEPVTYSWLRKTTLIAEAISLSHLGHLPKLLLEKEEQDLEIKYIGGLKVLLCFDNSVEARSFRENKQRWAENLKWVEPVESPEFFFFERIAWVRLVGLPLKLWGSMSFEAICKKFGKIIAPFDDVYHRVDLSCVKVGILTTRRTRINEEVEVATDDQITKVGVVEFDEDWFPFQFDSSKNFYEGQSCDEEGASSEDEEGISETWMEVGDEEP